MQRRGRMRERVAWLVMALLIGAAVLGLFGNGLLSSQSASIEGLTVSYERFGRYGADSVLEVSVSRDAFEGERFSVALGRDYLESMKLDDISPQPLEATLSGDEATYVFAAPDAPTASVRFDMTPADVGSIDATVGLAGASGDLSFTQFIYP